MVKHKLVHGAIIDVQSSVYPNQIGHLFGDVPALLIVALVLAYLIPRENNLKTV